MALDTYTKVNYVNNTKPNVSAGNLNHMDQAISDNRDAIITLQSGGGTGGGHTIQNSSGTAMAKETILQFLNADVSDDPTNKKTVVDCKGAKGDAATVAVGTVTTGAAGSSAAVTNSGSSSAAILNFTIPQGADGSNGTNGTSVTVKSATKTGKVTTVILTDSAGDHTITIDDGADGSGTGDMLKSVYDTNNDGIVDHAALADTATTATSATSAATSETCTGNAATATTAAGYSDDGAIATALAGKQATLTFDSTPTSGSTNPVTSGGVYTALSAKADKDADVQTVTLAASSWDSTAHTITVSVTGVTATSNQDILPLLATSTANITNNTNLAAAGIYDYGQAAGTITLYATTVPTADLQIRVIVRG